jgi:hypothetical protein
VVLLVALGGLVARAHCEGENRERTEGVHDLPEHLDLLSSVAVCD